MKILSLVLLLGLSMVYAKWGAPVDILFYVDPARISKATFTDASSGITYIGYCNSTDGLAYFGYLDNSGLFFTGPEILHPGLLCYHMEISGPHDGQHIYIAMEAIRSLDAEGCKKENNYAGCDDLFLFESQDAGQTWLPPKNVGGTPFDSFRRRSFKLLTNWNSPYLWLVYNQYVNGQLNIAAIRFETKKRTFDKEHVLVERFGDLNNYSLITVDDKGKSKLALFYTTPYTLAFQTMISLDEGATWQKGASLKGVCKGDKVVYKTFMSKGKYIMAGCGNQDQVFFTFSEDLGATWTELTQFPYKGVENVEFCTPENPLGTDAGLMVLYTKDKGMYFGYSPVPLGPFKSAYIPRGNYYFAARMDINCYYSNGELKVRFMYQARRPQRNLSEYHLYIIDNDDLTTTPEIENERKEDL